ncbi:MAG: 6,7-dimethyl-8-ribityllumazine synthase [Planctomycetota bacterium]|nr:6,7-dimethyl-8-ribityllumazine synthase [Planctomycetota bacterium]
MSRDDHNEPRTHRLRPGVRIAAVVSTYHHDVTGTMLDSAADTLEAAGLAPGSLHEILVPGSFEMPLVAGRLARRADVDAVLCFGLVLKGETEHDRYIAAAVSEGLMRVALDADKPVLFGVLTCSTLEQARARARREVDGGLDKGREVARAAIALLAALEEADGKVRRLEETG